MIDLPFAADEGAALRLSAAVLLLVALAHASFRWWVGRRAGNEAASGLLRTLRQMTPPVALLAWIHALYFAAGRLLASPDAGTVGESWQTLANWGYRLAVVATLCWLAQRLGRLIEEILLALPSRTESTWDDVMLPLAGKAARQVLPLVALILGAQALAVAPALAAVFRSGGSVMLIGVVAFVVYRIVDAAATLVLQHHSVDVGDNLQARAVHTQVVVLKKVAVSVIAVFTIASMLMVFEPVRQFGASILASAGIAGIILGLAAQRSIATLLAGFRIAITQPIRVDDVVIVENEWGRVEEITLTYVVVRIWDLRRLVLPITYFLEQPFQNWTRTSAEILGTVFLRFDYQVPVDALREQLTRILKQSARWDGQVNVLQVTDAGERSLEVRALMSAADASLAWDLRCEVREKLVDFVQRHYPDSLPRVRGSLDSVAVDA